MLRVGVLVSGGGTNLQAILDAIDDGRVQNAEVVTVVASRQDAYALERARQHHIPSAVVARKAYASADAFDAALCEALQAAQVDLVVLAGFLSILGPRFLQTSAGRVINVHPSLIPSFCGDGYYGLKVHEAALARGVKVTGATVHYVNEITDGGPILLQKAVEVKPDDTPESLQKRVMEEAEWIILPQAVHMIANGQAAFPEKHV